MNSQDFRAYWAGRRGISLEEMQEQGYVVLVCQCSDPRCQGWACMLKDQADCYIKDLPGFYGYRYPEEGE